MMKRKNMGQEAVDSLGQAQIAFGKSIIGPSWPSSGPTEAQIKALGAAAYANASTIPIVQPAVVPPTSAIANPGAGIISNLVKLCCSAKMGTLFSANRP
jgi:hypothetical protein